MQVLFFIIGVFATLLATISTHFGYPRDADTSSAFGAGLMIPFVVSEIINAIKRSRARSAPKRFVSACCGGERCYCGAPAKHKVEETVFDDDPTGHMTIGDRTVVAARHPLTSYICHTHFREIMGPAADDARFLLPPTSPLEH